MSKKLGKADFDTLTGLIQAKAGYARKEVRVGPCFGVDVSLVDLPGDLAMASTSDPLSLIPSMGLEESAWLSVHLIVNDMATTGFAPQYGQFVLNLPSTFSKQDFETYWNYIHGFCADVGMAITGGHTGFFGEQNSTIAGGGTVTTIAPKQDIRTSQGAQIGDVIICTKECALSSTAILAMSFPETVAQKLGKEIQQKASALFYQTSSLKDALAAVGTKTLRNGVTAMHDVTEGGVLGAIYELVHASGRGALIDRDKIIVGHVQKVVCDLFAIDPPRSIGAGSMIIACRNDVASAVIDALKAEEIEAAVVGEIKDKHEGVKIIENGTVNDLVYQEEDPYWAAFIAAFGKGWT